MTKFILINGIRREMTAEEEAKFNKDVVDTKALRDIQKNEETKKEDNKASGKQKLKDLGLDDDEIKALMGA
tara:strand:+ start:294 stop:506 length:213 start_codon:yes stop_codon:yes gene_type:complete